MNKLWVRISSIAIIFLSALLPCAAFGQTLQGTRVSPYHSLNTNQVSKLLPELMRTSSDSAFKVFKNEESLWGEARALMYEFRQYNLAAPEFKTDGRSNFEEAERPFMAMVYAGLGICNLAHKFPARKDEARKEVQWLLQAIQTRAVSGFMAPHFGEPFGTQAIKQSSVFVHGHFLYLALYYRNTFAANDFDSAIHKVATALSKDFSAQPFLASYRDMWYVSDNIPALAALRNYDRAFQTSLSKKPVDIFLKEVKEHYTDKYSGLICSYINPASKQPVSKPHGVGVMYGLVFLPEVDSAFAQLQWQQAKKMMIRELPQLIAADKQTAPYAALAGSFGKGLSACLEHPDRPGITDAERNKASSDSGPVFLGAGTSASGFALAAANKAGDAETATGLEKFAVKLGKPTWIENRLYYINMFHPVGQAVVFFGKTLR